MGERKKRERHGDTERQTDGKSEGETRKKGKEREREGRKVSREKIQRVNQTCMGSSDIAWCPECSLCNGNYNS